MMTSSLPRLAVLLWVLMAPVLAALYMTVPPSPDQSQFDWMAYISTQGLPFYVGSFDMNWPGAMWLHEAGLRLFGVNAWTWRLTDFLLMLSFTGATAAFLGRSGWKIAPFVFLVLYPPLYITSGGWMAGQRDIVATGFLLVACALAVPGARGEFVSTLVAGFFVSMAVLVRPTFLSFALGVVVLEALPLRTRSPRRLSRMARAGAFVLGLVGGFAAAAMAGLLLGNLDDWYQQTVEFSLAVYVGDPPQDWRVTLTTLFLKSWHWITAFGLVGLFAWLKRDRFGHELVLVIGVAATSIVSFFVQNKGFAYHLGGLLTVLVVFVAVGYDWLISLVRAPKPASRRVLAGMVLAVMAAVTLAGTASKLTSLRDGARLLFAGDMGPTDAYGLTEAERRRIVDMIKSGSSEADTVAVYGTNYELAFRAERTSPYRFFAAADQMDTDFAHFDAWLGEVEDALAQNPPRFVIVPRSVIANSIDDPEPAVGERFILSALLDAVSSGYAAVFENENLVVYRKAE